VPQQVFSPEAVPIKSGGRWIGWVAFVLVIGLLWVAKAVLLPLALGIVLAFLLTPLVRLFDRLHFPRFIGVFLTMMLALGAVGGVGYVIWNQFADLSAQATRYTSSMRQKVADARIGSGAVLRQLQVTLDKVTEQLDSKSVTDLRRAQPVRIVPPRLTPIERLQGAMQDVFEPIASAVIVLVLVAFMLGQREDLRDRIIRLIGASNVTMTTRLMDEAGQRVSQFILWQTLINLAFGVLVSIGLYWIGVPYAALWGGMTALLRFVPFVGTLLSSLIPAALAFAIFPGWTETLQTLALFLVLDMITAYFVEPVIFGQRTGVSSFALLVSALFWIWLWGPVGLLLATPLTVCIAVLGRHVRSLRFLAIIFADEPALSPHVRYYQRLLARDEDEAHSIVNAKVTELGVTGVMDQMLIPALSLTSLHRSQSEITEDDVNFILASTGEIVQQFREAQFRENKSSQPDAAGSDMQIAGIATASPIDQLVLDMLQIALNASDNAIDALTPQFSSEEAVSQAIRSRKPLTCIVSLSTTRGSEVRQFCRRLRADQPQTNLLVLRPMPDEVGASRSAQRIREAGADVVVTTIEEAVGAISEWAPRGRIAPAAVATGPARDQRSPNTAESFNEDTRAIQFSVR
jgi:predicted PurR-regulated permease PerM